MHTLVVCALTMNLACLTIHNYTLTISIANIWHSGVKIEEQIKAWGYN
jgi:hypothetical protein